MKHALRLGDFHPRRRKGERLLYLTLALSFAAGGVAFPAAAEQPPKLKACAAAVVDKEYLAVHCPKGKLVELLTSIRDRTGVNFDLPPDLLSTPISVVLDKSPLQSALDAVLAKFNYTLDGTATLSGGRATGTSVIIYSLRESSSEPTREVKSETPPPARRAPAPEPAAEVPPPAPEPAAAEQPQPALGGQPPVMTSFPPSVPEVSAEQEARAREAFFANLPKSGATLPQVSMPAQLPPSPSVTNQTGPGDGRRGLPLPEFTPGPETATPPGIPR